VEFTVVIATCNRPDRLPATLEAVGGAIRGAGGRQGLIVADNGSARSARDAVEGFARNVSFPVRYLPCPPLHRSKAMNAGVQAAKTDWIAFTDDDTLPDPGWLKCAAAFAAGGACRIFGGRIVPEPATQPLPRWLRPGRSGRVPGHVIFVRYEPRKQSGILAQNEPVPFGANFFVHKDLFRRYGGFDERLWDLCGAAALGGDDTEFEIRVQKAGEPIGYCHEAVIRHPVHHERCNLWDQVRLAYRYGWRDPMVFFEPNRPALEPYELKMLLSRLGRAPLDLAMGDAAGAVDDLLKAARSWGTMVCRWSRPYREWRALQAARGAGRAP
jgi:GT2 family glycosyltransferase